MLRIYEWSKRPGDIVLCTKQGIKCTWAISRWNSIRCLGTSVGESLQMFTVTQTSKLTSGRSVALIIFGFWLWNIKTWKENGSINGTDMLFHPASSCLNFYLTPKRSSQSNLSHIFICDKCDCNKWAVGYFIYIGCSVPLRDWGRRNHNVTNFAYGQPNCQQ